MNLSKLGKMQKNILKLLSVDGAYLSHCTDYRTPLEISFSVNYDSNMIGDDCGDSFTISEISYKSLVMREGMFQKMNHPSSLEVEITAYELTPSAKEYFKPQ